MYKEYKEGGIRLIKILPIFIYVVVVIIGLFAPTSEGYNVFYWQFLIAQIYAIPAFCLTVIILSIYQKSKK